MILYDKTALTEKYGRKVASYIETLLTPESGEREIRNALERLMNVDTGKYIKKYGDEPPEICIAASVGFLRLEGGDDSQAGAVAIDNFNEAIRLCPELGNDTLFRNDFIYELIKAGAEQDDKALMALLCDMYVGDVTAPGPKAHFESDGMTLEELEDAIEAVSNAAAGAEEDGEAVAVTGISPDQLKEELWWLPYEENGYALSRRYAVEGKMALEGGDKEAAAESFFKSAMLGSYEAAAEYVSLTSEVYSQSAKDRTLQLKERKLLRKINKKADRARYSGIPAEEIAAMYDTAELSDCPAAIYERSRLLKDVLKEESLRLLELAADKGDHDAEQEAAFYYGDPEHFDFEKMMRYLFQGLVNPGSFAKGPKAVPFGEFIAPENAYTYRSMTGLLGDLCAARDMIDDLEELSEPKETFVPELTPEQKRSVFMWFLCDPGSDERREVLARLYDEGFGTAVDHDKALSIRKELCLKYAPEGIFEGAAGSSSGDRQGPEDDEDEAEEPFMPYESFYTYALKLITSEGKARDTETGKKLLALIPEDSAIHQKAAKLLALTETETSELLRLGNMFRKEGNDDAMIRIYEAAEKLGDPVAARVLGRYYMLPENGADNEKAMEHLRIGASRGDVQSMYFAGAALQERGDAPEAAEYYEQCAETGEASEDQDDRAVAARAMKDLSELCISGALTGEKDVPKYLYWLDRAVNAGYKLSDVSVDKRRSAENYFKPAQWQETFASAMEQSDGRYQEWAVKVCAERKIPAAMEELGVRLYRGEWNTPVKDASGRPVSALSMLRTPALSSPRAQYYVACALYLGKDCEKDLEQAASILPSEEEFGDPEKLRHEIAGMAAYIRAGELGEHHSDEAEKLLKNAEKDLAAALNDCGNEMILYELSDILMRAYDVPDKYEAAQVNEIWKNGYRYLLRGYGREKRCTSRIDAFSPGRMCEIAGMFEGDEALSWYLIAANRDPAAQYGAGSIYLDRGRDAESGKVVDRDALDKAKELIARAASLEFAAAELAMYKERKYLEVDQETARLFLKRAAVHGSDEAKELCKEAEIAF